MSEDDLEAAWDSGERGQAFLTGWTDELRDLGFAVDVIGSGLGLDAHVVDGTCTRVQHLTATQLETEVAVDVDRGSFAFDLTLET